MSDKCPKCDLPVKAGHVCIHRLQKRSPPELEIVDGSEITAEVDTSAMGTDGIFRPIVLEQEGDVLMMTVEDAQRLYDFLDEAIPYLEGKVWQNN